MKKEILKIATIFLITIGVVVWGLNYIFFGAPKSKATGETMNLSFTPATATVAANTDFTVNILAKPSINTVLRGYSTKVNFDKTKLAFKSIQYKVGVSSQGLGNVTADIASINAQGYMSIIGEDTTATGYTLGAANGSEIVSVTFTALATTATTVTFSDSSFYSINSDTSLFSGWTIAAQNLDVNGGGCTTYNLASSSVTAGANNTTVVSCNYGLQDLNCVAGSIKVGTTASSCVFSSFSGNNALFNCNVARTDVTSAECSTFVGTNANCCATSTSISGTTGNVNLKMKLKFQGIAKQPATAQNSMTVKVKVQKDGESTSVDGTGTFTADAAGVWTGAVGVNIPTISGKYKIMVKGPQHIQKKVCDSTPTETAGAGLYRCSAGNVTLVAGDNNLDFSGILLLAGDLDQSGIVDSVDFGLVRNNLGKTDAATLAQADINRDGKVDTQDFSLIIAALGIRTDEQ